MPSQNRKEDFKSPDSTPSLPIWEMAMNLQDNGQPSLTQQNGAYLLFSSLLTTHTLAFAQLFSSLEDPHFVSWPVPPCGENHADFKACGGFPPCRGSSLSWEWMGLQGKEGPLVRPLTLRTTPMTPLSLTAPIHEHTESVSHSEHFPPSLAWFQASPQLQLRGSPASPHWDTGSSSPSWPPCMGPPAWSQHPAVRLSWGKRQAFQSEAWLRISTLDLF